MDNHTTISRTEKESSYLDLFFLVKAEVCATIIFSSLSKATQL